ncbi:DUF2163 domain-containing protein [Cereibacter sphaeroides]|uniref:DUF2163 domain-containing protein n=1 Tax=Cereibacter sphaeroides TaxID=1063 RepID=UPI000F52A384|nr:DUF2163 domain-containing protein [Cereibacter sphaeroides]AZB64166.1 DUF2163 domain-containing protein [Cereibacter sphaeroides]AZB67911.1 DUF2163 domain-containing protein [Cereibacter sphaeroides]
MGAAELHAHLKGGAATVCRCWAVTRRDGTVFGFTDHDRDLTFEGRLFRAETGLTSSALQQTTGLSVDNAETVGALSHVSVTEADLLAGRFDGAEVLAWLVNWANVSERLLQFRGMLGEITHSGGRFRAELRGLTEALNQPQGRVYQRACQAVLGDRACGVDLSAEEFATERAVETVVGRQSFGVVGLHSFPDRWFEQGRLVVMTGEAAGAMGVIKSDRYRGEVRTVELWEALGPQIAVGDRVRLEAGCDRRSETCRLKFDNFRNFRGFPHLPGEDWLSAYPAATGTHDGGSLWR